jgi:hypothetical protein
MTDDLIPVITQPGFNQKTIRKQPAILEVAAELGVVSPWGRTVQKNRVTRAGRSLGPGRLRNGEAILTPGERQQGLAFAQK